MYHPGGGALYLTSLVRINEILMIEMEHLLFSRRLDLSGNQPTRLLERLHELEASLERERAGARKLRDALETAAIYFHAPLNNPEDDDAWQQIVTAIRSDAGRAVE
jgi:hypothetical protein